MYFSSATWPLGVRRLAKSYCEHPIQVYVGSLDLAAVHTVTQSIVMLNNNDEKFDMVIIGLVIVNFVIKCLF